MVDIFHFVLGYILQFSSKEDAFEIIFRNKGQKSITKMPTYFDETNNMDLDKILLPYENFMLLCLKKEENIEEFVKSFFECLDSS
jgi:hypothetical protein